MALHARRPRLQTDAARAAVRAGLHYVRPGVDPGYRRRRVGQGFVYLTARGARLADPAIVARIRKLAIPPAWSDVWISADPRGHVQATGRDARGRLQYRYHPDWSQVRGDKKFAELADFCAGLPTLRERVRRDQRCACLCRRQVVATIVVLMEKGHLRVGNEEYTRQNGTHGVTTLERRHVRLAGARIELAYRGKAGVARHVIIDDARSAEVLRRCLALPGKRVFKYLDDVGRVRRVTSADVNEYIREHLGERVTAKYFRTWAATLCCLGRRAGQPAPTSATAGKRTVNAVIKEVAARLGHTPTVCRKSYVHPLVIERYLGGELAASTRAAIREAEWRFGGRWVGQAERALLALVAARRALEPRR